MNLETSTILYHHPNDTGFAEQLASDLGNAGFEVQVFSGQTSLKAIEILNYEHLLLVLSSAALAEGSWVAYFRAFQMQRRYVSIVRIDDTPIPPALNQMHWVDFELGYRVGFNGLMIALRAPQIPSESIDLSVEDPATLKAIYRQMQRAMLVAFMLYIVGTGLLYVLL